MSKLPTEYRRPQFWALLDRLREPRRFIQVLAGPRQTGKTTLAHQVLAACNLPHHYASADDPLLRDPAWILAQWELARRKAREGGKDGGVLALDEIHKVPRWADAVKQAWDEDSRGGVPLRVVLLGSAPLLMMQGLTESLAGRFEVIRMGHWSYREMQEAFGWDLDRYLYFGGYPGAAPLVGDEARWRAYMLDSLVETTVSRDILLLHRVEKPALLRRLFVLGCEYSGQVLSYQKMLGQLVEAGNTVTLAHYLELLGAAGMVIGLQKYTRSRVLRRGSSPKLVALNTALVSATLAVPFARAREDPELWGRLVETAVGAHLANTLAGTGAGLYYWRERDREVDYVVESRGSLTAIEVRSGRRPRSLRGLEAFRKAFGKARVLVVGSGGVPLEEFLQARLEDRL